MRFFRRFALGLLFAGSLPAQTFLQFSDTQFGMFSKNKGFAHETANMEFAIATANRLQPDFVVVTGDLINQPGNAEQTAEYKRIAAKLYPKIRLFNVAGNHDVGNEPTKESLALYRERFGPDYYTFRIGDMAGFVLNSSLEKAPGEVEDEAAKMEAWLGVELAKANKDGVRNLIVIQHIPFFVKDANEPDVYNNIPGPARQRYLKLLHTAGVKHVFAGHLHFNLEARDGDLELVASGPVGMPLGKGKSGIRVVTVAPNGVSHKYFEFGELPEALKN